MSNAKKIQLVIAIIVLIVGYYLKPQENTIDFPADIVIEDANGFNYLPSSTTGVIIKHDGYQLSYNEQHEQAEWVAYSLSKSDIVYNNFKRPYFINDPKVKTKSANWRSYKKSGYDRGHLCPAGDKRYSKEAHDETFYTSNITPQKHDFNAGVWNKLEQKTRYWAKKHNQLYIVTGGVLKPNLKTIGKDKVSVPNQFYKIILDYTQPEIKAIAFLFPHEESKKPLYEFVVSIDALEEKTGIDFFPELPDAIETKLEASSNYKNWSFR
ncbi:DNA/RNA non-specific endonuclease [Tenacibaculum retecalamus]|uniref:DNA/RNA non-specific endonuclease n=1 Tax=Tenacibaculum retecalamus TaxID=3018315 RepID=UPI0023D93861|nr:DNA/RNA non-specific endonuclease [Tenacibaculum retecalamus]WBX70865.1 DNA/RNA non-specific endonuclease [Tenacibaculum retecalamus]